MKLEFLGDTYASGGTVSLADASLYVSAPSFELDALFELGDLKAADDLLVCMH
jgi:hypothetical protein